ncbi:MAG: hypothetical protein ACFFDN_01965 [Candidatus Hodarchaeota archaeon]
MSKIICSECKRIIGYKRHLIDNTQPSRGLCERCAFILRYLSFSKFDYPILRFFIKRKAKIIFNLCNPNFEKNLKEKVNEQRFLFELSKECILSF